MDRVGQNCRKELCNTGKQKVRMKRSCVLGFPVRNTENIFEMVDGAFHGGAAFVYGIPALGTTERAGIKAKVLLWVYVHHATAGRGRTGVFTMTDPAVFSIIAFAPGHFGADEFEGGRTATQM